MDKALARHKASFKGVWDCRPLAPSNGSWDRAVDDEIVISGVRNGANKETLEGPFKVWVRSTGEDVTNAQYKRMMTVQLEAIRKRKAEGDTSITDEVIDRVKGFVDEGRPMLIGSSASDVRDNDLVN